MNALCLGGADCVWDDVDRSKELLGEGWWNIVVACNEAGRDWPGTLNHWVSLHPQKLLRLWAPDRESEEYETWSDPKRGEREPADTDHHLDNWGGSSGLFCVQVALEVGGRAVCCGMPMTPDPHYFGDAPWQDYEGFRSAWVEHQEEMKTRVRSMSGWTRELLGAPTPEWLAQDRATA